MDNLKRSLNEYLFLEFAGDGDESQISENWPFNLQYVGQVSGSAVFEFDDVEPYFALAGDSLNFMPKAGMTFEDLQLQQSGSIRIAARDPVDLSMSMIGVAVPSALERRRSLEALAVDLFPGRQAEILEGLLLRRELKYIGLFCLPGEQDAIVAGLSREPIEVSFPQASDWRRLAWGVGWWLKQTTREEGY
jgi:hypothetical protein